MRLMLSNYGLRFLDHLGKEGTISQDPSGPLLRELFEKGLLPTRSTQQEQEAQRRGLIQVAPESASTQSVFLRYKRNPLEHVIRLIFEYTTVCNLDCLHCRNGHLPATTEKHPERLSRAVFLMTQIGVRRFDFIGGEVTLYGHGWLDLVRTIGKYPGAMSAVLTSGWFLGETDFRAAGQTYKDDHTYLHALKEAGLTYVIFSLDGPERLHDKMRQVPGLYQRVLEGFAKVRDTGLIPRLSLLISPELRDNEQSQWMADLAYLIYKPEDPSAGIRTLVQRLLSDPVNYISNLVDVGNAVGLTRKQESLATIPDELIRCKNFFRPSPNLRIKASGELSLCPLVEGGDGYGNVHERDFLDLLNGMQDTLPYQLHADGSLVEYRRFLEPSLFGGSIDHVCTLRTVLMMIARELSAKGISPADTKVDPVLVRQINLEVAQKAGFLPELRQIGKVATGHPRPRAK